MPSKHYRIRYTVKGNRREDGSPVQYERWSGAVAKLAPGEAQRIVKDLLEHTPNVADAWYEECEIGDWVRTDAP